MPSQSRYSHKAFQLPPAPRIPCVPSSRQHCFGHCISFCIFLSFIFLLASLFWEVKTADSVTIPSFDIFQTCYTESNKTPKPASLPWYTLFSNHNHVNDSCMDPHCWEPQDLFPLSGSVVLRDESCCYSSFCFLWTLWISLWVTRILFLLGKNLGVASMVGGYFTPNPLFHLFPMILTLLWAQLNYLLFLRHVVGFPDSVPFFFSFSFQITPLRSAQWAD